MDPNSQKLFIGASGKKKPYIGDIAFAQTSLVNKTLKVFEFEAGVGYGTELVGIDVGADAATVAFNSTRNALAVGYSATLAVYNYTPGSGLGTSSTVSTSSSPTNVIFSNNGANVIVAVTSSPRVRAYPWSSGSGIGTAYSNPSTLPTGAGNGLAIAADDSALAVAHNASPYISVYAWSNSTGFGTKYSDPSSALPGNANSTVFNNTGNVIFVSTATSPRIHAYAWSNSTGFGTKFSNPSTIPPQASLRRIAITPTDDAIFMATSDPSAYAWDNSTGFGAKYSDPASTTSVGTSVAITPNGDTVFFTNDSSGTQALRAAAYPWSSATGFGARYTGVTHDGQPTDVAVLPT